ncbi:hypothetical protein [Parasitella parasitica]|uniref:DUF3824 domain-containing protein n=1 Tax=Parasitella parasitica TaxID=35722 RepID=A0A0B7N6U1_9FUNG|nr:hypothetical protein [Parasitella parasitica]
MYSNQNITETTTAIPERMPGSMPEEAPGNNHTATNTINVGNSNQTEFAPLNHELTSENIRRDDDIGNTRSERDRINDESFLSKATEQQNNADLFLGNRGDHSIRNSNDHHYKRDAALTAGATGPAGHELNKHHNNQPKPDASHHNGIESTPHKDDISDSKTFEPEIGHSSAGNRHEIRDSTGLTGHVGDQHGRHSGLGTSENSSSFYSASDNVKRSSNDNDHHYKRDVALGGGVAGATGIAGLDVKKHHDKQTGLDNNHKDISSHIQPDSSNIIHSFNDNDHHRTRDAALGASTNGVAGSEMQKHPNENKNTSSSQVRASNNSSPKSSTEKKGAAAHDKPLNTGGDAHHIAEQPPLGLGGLTGKQPVGEVNFHKLT